MLGMSDTMDYVFSVMVKAAWLAGDVALAVVCARRLIGSLEHRALDKDETDGVLGLCCLLSLLRVSSMTKYVGPLYYSLFSSWTAAMPLIAKVSQRTCLYVFALFGCTLCYFWCLRSLPLSTEGPFNGIVNARVVCANCRLLLWQING